MNKIKKYLSQLSIFTTLIIVFIFLIFESIIGGIIVLSVEQESSLSYSTRIDISGRQRMLSQRIALYSNLIGDEIVEGRIEPKNLSTLEEMVILFEDSLVIMNDGGDPTTVDRELDRNIPTASEEVSQKIADVREVWNDYKKNANFIVSLARDLFENNDDLSEIDRNNLSISINSINENSDVLLQLSDEVATEFVKEDIQIRFRLLPVLIGSIVLNIIILGLALLLLRKQLLPLKDLLDYINQSILRDKLPENVPNESNSREVRVIVNAFNKFSEKVKRIYEQKDKEIKDKTKKLESLNESLSEENIEINRNLEAIITNRTIELKEKISQLDRLNKGMVDRELEMIKLKKKIKSLESKLEEQGGEVDKPTK